MFYLLNNENGVDRMAQLIKLSDYVSRYETNPFHYPGQYIRLKQENWRQLYEAWEEERRLAEIAEAAPKIEVEKDTKFRWNPFAKKSDVEEYEEIMNDRDKLPRTREQLVQYFLNQLYPFQLKWATTTLSQVSYTDRKYNNEPNLKYFLQRFPDIYLLMYYPTFNVQNTPIDGEIILISPIGIDVITLMEEHPDTNIIVSDERTWTLEMNNSQTKIISPMISLKRTEQIVKSILNRYEIDFPVNKMVLSKTNHILYHTEPYNTTIVGKREFKKWFEKAGIKFPSEKYPTQGN